MTPSSKGKAVLLLCLASLLIFACGCAQKPDAETYLHEAYAAYDRCEYENAADLSNAALERGLVAKDQAEAYEVLGDAHLAMGEYEAAVEHYEQSLEANGPDALVLVNMGLAYEQLQKPETAKDCYLKAVEADPDNAAAHYQLGLFYRLGNPDAALESLERAVELAPTGEHYLAYAELLMAAGRNVEAEAALGQVGPEEKYATRKEAIQFKIDMARGEADLGC